MWSFKRNRYPGGRIREDKARICAHEGMQTWDDNYWESYAHVVAWLSIRTLLVLTVVHDLEIRSIDFTLVFSQAGLDVDVYMELPPRFDMNGSTRNRVLKLNKSIYSLCQSRHNW